jgi:protein PET100
MTTPSVEVFKFGFYMFFPIYIMFKFGDPQW